MTSLTHVRGFMASSTYFVIDSNKALQKKSGSVLPKLSSQGNLLAGAITRVSIGVLLNPFSVLKARFEVCTILT